MGFLDRFGKKVELSVETDKPEYVPGEVVTATVRVGGGKKDLDVEEGRAELVCENEYEYRAASASTRGGSSTYTETERTEHAVERFLEAGTVRAGESSAHTVSLTLPEDAVPTGKGEITEVRWKVEAILGRRRALDPDGSAEVRVVSPSSAYASRASSEPELDTHGDCDLEVRLRQAPHARPGDTIAGTLVITPRSEVEADEVRVELVRRERVPRDHGNTEEKVDAKTILGEAADLSPGIPREYPFELSVPTEGCPTLETEHSTVRWELRGVVSRRLRSDYNVSRPLNVYTGPDDADADVGDSSTDGLGVFKEPPGG
ncbi:MAG: sporulation protein [Actinomycetota bacterium]|nr:sporulation protein [Actinomycetota bacterium]